MLTITIYTKNLSSGNQKLTVKHCVKICYKWRETNRAEQEYNTKVSDKEMWSRKTDEVPKGDGNVWRNVSSTSNVL